MILPPTSENSHHHKVTNIAMSPTSLSPYNIGDKDKSLICFVSEIRHQYRCGSCEKTSKNNPLVCSNRSHLPFILLGIVLAQNCTQQYEESNLFPQPMSHRTNAYPSELYFLIQPMTELMAPRVNPGFNYIILYTIFYINI